MPTISPSSATETLTAAQAAKTPKQARRLVREAAREAREHAHYMNGLYRSAGYEGPGPGPYPEPAPRRTAQRDEPISMLTQNLRMLESMARKLATLTLPDVLEPHVDLCVAFGKVCQQRDQLLCTHPAVRQGLYGPPPASPKTSPRQKTPTPQTDGGRTQAVERMAALLQRFTCPELAKKLGEDRRAVKLVLTRKMKQGKVRKEGQTYTWVAV